MGTNIDGHVQIIKSKKECMVTVRTYIVKSKKYVGGRKEEGV